MPDQLQPAQVHEQPAQGEAANHAPFRRIENAALLRLRPRMLEQLRVVHTGGTRRHARQAAEAEIHFVRERLRRLQLAIRDGTHQRDATARAVALELGGVVGRAGGQTQPAVHALLHHGVIEILEMRSRRVHHVNGARDNHGPELMRRNFPKPSSCSSRREEAHLFHLAGAVQSLLTSAATSARASSPGATPRSCWRDSRCPGPRCRRPCRDPATCE